MRAREWNATELLRTKFPEPRWAVPGLVPEGVSLLVGAPKTGKSWLALGLGVSVAQGGKALGEVACDAGDVLYLALEDSPRRLKTRLKLLLDKGPAPSRLTVATEWQGIEQVERWLSHHSDARLIIVDVLARVREEDETERNVYSADYKALQPFRELAISYGVAIIIVHHIRKMGATDWLERVSGTNGLAGAADTVLMLQRSRGTDDARLLTTGRDVEEDERPMAFDPLRGRWALLEGPASDYDVSDQRRTVVRVLRENGALGPKAISRITGINHEAVRQLLRRMVNAGEITKDGRGLYLSHPSQRHNAPTPDGQTVECDNVTDVTPTRAPVPVTSVTSSQRVKKLKVMKPAAQCIGRNGSNGE